MSHAAPLVVFDLDGTVLDTLPGTFHCMQRVVRRFLGREPSIDEILRRFGASDHRIITEWVGKRHAEEAVSLLYDCYEERFRETGPFPGIVDLIRRLRMEGRTTSLFTGRGRPSTEFLLRAQNLETLFDLVLTGDDVAASKPSPEGLLRTLDHFGRRPEEAVYVGDTAKDVMSAVDAGVVPAIALWASPDAEALRGEASGPSFETVAELSAWFGGGGGGDQASG